MLMFVRALVLVLASRLPRLEEHLAQRATQFRLTREVDVEDTRHALLEAGEPVHSARVRALNWRAVS